MQDVTRLSFERYTSTSQKYIQAQAQAQKQVIQLYKHKSRKLKFQLVFTGTHNIL